MCIDIDISDTPYAVTLPQGFDNHTAIIEDTKPGSLVARCVVQPGDGHKGVSAAAAHDIVERCQGGAYHRSSGLVDAFECRCITTIQVAFTGYRLLLDPGKIFPTMKT